MTDKINPEHYKSHPSGIECIEVTRHHDFNVGNVLKYLWRAGLKDGETNLDDLKKAQWYLGDEIDRLSQTKVPELEIVRVPHKVTEDTHNGADKRIWLINLKTWVAFSAVTYRHSPSLGSFVMAVIGKGKVRLMRVDEVAETVMHSIVIATGFNGERASFELKDNQVLSLANEEFKQAEIKMYESNS